MWSITGEIRIFIRELFAIFWQEIFFRSRFYSRFLIQITQLKKKNKSRKKFYRRVKNVKRREPAAPASATPAWWRCLDLCWRSATSWRCPCAVSRTRSSKSRWSFCWRRCRNRRSPIRRTRWTPVRRTTTSTGTTMSRRSLCRRTTRDSTRSPSNRCCPSTWCCPFACPWRSWVSSLSAKDWFTIFNYYIW